jgi:hypothetical protein
MTSPPDPAAFQLHDPAAFQLHQPNAGLVLTLLCLVPNASCPSLVMMPLALPRAPCPHLVWMPPALSND